MQTQYDDEPDIVLDFFAGSGTTAHAIMELNRQDSGNRKCILVTNNEITDINPNGIALDVTTKRLKRIMSGECYDGAKNFEWIKKNKPYRDNLCVYRIETISKYAQGNTTHPLAPSAGEGERECDNSASDNKKECANSTREGGIHQNHSTNQNLSVLDAIDECAYGLERLENIHDKAKWIAQNFEITLEKLEEIKPDSERANSECARLECEKLDRQAKGE